MTMTLDDLSAHRDGCVRTARKEYRCRCADEFTRWEVKRTCEHGWTASTARTAAEADAIAAEKVGARCHGTSVPAVENIEIIPIRNPDYRAECGGTIIREGDRYFEYLADAEPFHSGSRYCAECAVAVWGATVSR